MGQYPCGDQEVMEAIADHGKYESGRFPELSAADRAVAGMLMDIFDLELPPIARVERVERLRGRVPDRVLAAAYNTARNYAFGDPETVALVRERAGVIDKGGTVMPGYVLWETAASSMPPKWSVGDGVDEDRFRRPGQRRPTRVGCPPSISFSRRLPARSGPRP